jgi:hypothetical protein
MDGPHLLPRFERQPDGAWLCVEPATINRPDGPIAIEPGMRFTFGEKHEGSTWPSTSSSSGRNTAREGRRPCAGAPARAHIHLRGVPDRLRRRVAEPFEPDPTRIGGGTECA